MIKMALVFAIFSCFSMAHALDSGDIAELTPPAVVEEISCGEFQGVKLPCWTDFKRSNEGDESLPFFPYAKRPNGCTVFNYRPGEMDTFEARGEHFSFKEACDNHDKCYYTLGSLRNECNKAFYEDLSKECSHGNETSKPACMRRASIFYNGVSLAASIVHTNSQERQQAYIERVMKYVHDYKQNNNE